MVPHIPPGTSNRLTLNVRICRLARRGMPPCCGDHRLRKVLFVSRAASSRMKLPAQSRSWGLRDELALTLPRSLLANGVAAP